MRLITCDRGRLHALFSQRLAGRGEVFSTGLEEVDRLLPGGGLARGAVHEILSEPGEGATPFFFAMLLARAAAESEDGLNRDQSHGAILWCDPGRTIYPPALAAAGIHLDRLYLVRPRTARDLLWAMGESLRCPGVAAAVAIAERLSRLEARRLQLAAETGGGAGLLLRRMLKGPTDFGELNRAAAPWALGRCPPIYAAATRWVVSPAAGEANVQRWKIRLVHCHGGNTEKTILLEHSRETNSVRAVVELGDRMVGGERIGMRVVGA